MKVKIQKIKEKIIALEITTIIVLLITYHFIFIELVIFIEFNAYKK
jgi:hypothetical protein